MKTTDDILETISSLEAFQIAYKNSL